MRKHIFIAAAVSVLLSAGVFGLFIRRSDSALQAQKPDLRAETLRTLAQRSGAITATARPTNLRRYDNVGTLAGESGAIIIGMVVSKSSQMLSPAEKFIVTDFQITVSQAIKGVLPAGQSIRVRTPGGRVDFGEGKYAEVKMPDFWQYPEVGKVYVFFLETRKDGTFVPRGGPQGIFEVTPDEKIQPQVRPEDKLMQNYEGKNLKSFISEIRGANG